MREKCFTCMRPTSSCMCKYTLPIQTNTKFVILMHPMEHRKIKNGSGRLTHLQLKNSEIIVDIDYTKNNALNTILDNTNNDCFILYPGLKSINLSVSDPKLNKTKNTVIILIDATWPCAKKMLKLSKNLHGLKRMSFDNTDRSKFKIKQQPNELCLSTIESTLKVINLLKVYGYEDCDTKNFLNPFNKMVEYQIECIKNPHNKAYRPFQGDKLSEKTNYKMNSQRVLFYEDENFKN